jgi:hypothetical protein
MGTTNGVRFGKQKNLSNLRKKRVITMAEFEVEATLNGETDVEIDFSNISRAERFLIFLASVLGKKHTFKDIYVELEGTTFVEIEPMGYE